MRRSFLVGLVPVLAFAAVSFASTKEAHAGPIVGLDLDLGTAFQHRASSSVDFSVGGGARLGYRFGIPGTLIYVQPEIGGHYMRFGFNADDIGYDYAATLNGGVKLGLSGIVQPNLFAHVGLGILGYNVGGGAVTGYLGPEADIGAGLDFRVLPGFLLGAHIAFNSASVPSVDNRDAARWVNFGVTAGFHFGEAPARRTYVRRVYY